MIHREGPQVRWCAGAQVPGGRCAPSCFLTKPGAERRRSANPRTCARADLSFGDSQVCGAKSRKWGVYDITCHRRSDPGRPRGWHDNRTLHPLMALAQDLRYSVRAMARTPGFAAALVASAAIGIGANAVVFGFIGNLVDPAAVMPGVTDDGWQ